VNAYIVLFVLSIQGYAKVGTQNKIFALPHEGLLKVKARDDDILACDTIQSGTYQFFGGTSCIISSAETLKTKASGLTETLVPVYQCTRRHITEDRSVDTQRCDHLKCHVCVNHTGNIPQVLKRISV
jgi:hypothetical protein